jgi:hypothetical protein
MRENVFVVVRSPPSAGETAKYEQIASFPTVEKAEAYVRAMIYDELEGVGI